jgi:phage-related protein
MQFLRSLIDGLTRVVRGILDFIGSLWSRIYKYVGSALKPLWQQIKGFARVAYDTAVSVVTSIYSTLIRSINTAYNQARQYAKSLVDGVLSTARNLINSAIRGVNRVIQGVIALATSTYNWARGQVSAIIANISTVWKWVHERGDAMYNIISSWLRVFTSDNLSRFLYLITNLFPSIFNFFKDPVHFVQLWLEPMLLDMLYWLLAYAMGTKEASLPRKPKNYG